MTKVGEIIAGLIILMVVGSIIGLIIYFIVSHEGDCREKKRYLNEDVFLGCMERTDGHAEDSIRGCEYAATYIKYTPALKSDCKK